MQKFSPQNRRNFYIPFLVGLTFLIIAVATIVIAIVFDILFSVDCVILVFLVVQMTLLVYIIVHMGQMDKVLAQLFENLNGSEHATIEPVKLELQAIEPNGKLMPDEEMKPQKPVKKESKKGKGEKAKKMSKPTPKPKPEPGTHGKKPRPSPRTAIAFTVPMDNTAGDAKDSNKSGAKKHKKSSDPRPPSFPANPSQQTELITPKPLGIPEATPAIEGNVKKEAGEKKPLKTKRKPDPNKNDGNFQLKNT